MKYDICVIGGFGHIGLPLSIAFASKGMHVCALDVDKEKYNSISKGEMPFMERGGAPLLKKTLYDSSLTLSLDPSEISNSKNVIITIGTPPDLHLSPKLNELENLIMKNINYFRDGQLIVLRSTIYLNTTNRVAEIFKKNNKMIDVAYCPERIVQGAALEELFKLPQIVSSTTEAGVKRATELFSVFVDDFVILSPQEAEFAKLFTNAWRYITFAASNQFFTIADAAGLDYYKIYNAMKHNYSRNENLPTAGFTSGPCLFKDTLQLNSIHNNNFSLGNAAMLANEGMPFYVVSKLKQKHDLKQKSIGILGMAFKSEIDDKRDSLAYKLYELLVFEAKNVYCSDIYIKEDGFVSAEELVKNSDIIILGAPHKDYKNIKFDRDKTVVDIWNFYGNGCKI